MWRTPAIDTIEPVLGESPEVLRWQFFRGLRTSKLLPPEEIDLLERETQSVPIDAVQKMLLDQELLTPYQLGRIRDGRAAGLVFGQYRILDEIGAGGFGQVFKARHVLLERVLALKLSAADACQNRLHREVFQREVAAVTRLNHPNVATTFDANEIDGARFLAMEYVEGPTLHDFVCDKGPPPLALACAIMLQATEGLRHAHENGVVHRDIKPANILLPGVVASSRPKGPGHPLVKVIDFGLARLLAQGDRSNCTFLVSAGAVVGTPAFMSPEQATNFHDADTRSDLYSLGCTFYFLLTGQVPFDGASSRITLEMHAGKQVRPLRELRPEIPVGLAAIVHRLLAKKPADRYQTAAELSAALGHFALSGPSASAGVPFVGPRPTPAPLPRPPRDGTEPTHPREPARDRTPAPALELRKPAERVPVVALRRLWLEWCVVIESRVRGEALDISAHRYAELYRALISALDHADESPSGPTAAQRDRLRTLIEPWVALRALRALDPSAVAELWLTCQEYDRMFAEPAERAAPRWSPRLTVPALGALALGIAWVVAHWRLIVSAVGGGGL